MSQDTNGYNLIEETLRERQAYGRYEQDTDEALPIREAETGELLDAYIHIASLKTQLFEELEFRYGREEHVETVEQMERIGEVVGNE